MLIVFPACLVIKKGVPSVLILPFFSYKRFYFCFFSACPAFFVKVGFFPFQFAAFFLAVVAVEKLFPVILLLRTALFGISAFGTAKLSFLCCLGRSGLGGFLLSRSRFSRTAVFASSVIAFFHCFHLLLPLLLCVRSG